MDRPRTLAELAAMVRIMRRDQENWDHCMTQAAAMKRAYSERVVDSAVQWILADEPAPAAPETDEEAAAVAVYFATNQL